MTGVPNTDLRVIVTLEGPHKDLGDLIFALRAIRVAEAEGHAHLVFGDGERQHFVSVHKTKTGWSARVLTKQEGF